jgi:hypothetical protein
MVVVWSPLFLQFNDGVQPTWHLRAESTREKKSWIVRLTHVHAIVRWVSATAAVSFHVLHVFALPGSVTVVRLAQI